MSGADMSCNCKDVHQQAGGEVSAPPRLQADGQDGEREVRDCPEVEEARSAFLGNNIKPVRTIC